MAGALAETPFAAGGEQLVSHQVTLALRGGPFSGERFPPINSRWLAIMAWPSI
jgi:hypothetical protein